MYKQHVVRQIKVYHHTDVKNAMYHLGWVWDKPTRVPTNIDRMLEGVPKHHLELILVELQQSVGAHNRSWKPATERGVAG